MAVAGVGYGNGMGTGKSYYDPRNASYEEIQSFYSSLRTWRDEQFRVGNMVGYRNAAQVCDAWKNAINKQEGVEEYLDMQQGRVRLYEREGRLESGIIGLHVFEDSGQFFSMSASYAKDSTAENPIVEVRIKQEEGVSSIRQITVQIAVNQVDVSSATQLEMFALCSHGDKQGLAGFSKTGDSYRKLLEQAQEAGNNCNQAVNLTDFFGKKQNWSVLEKTTEAQIQSLLEERTKADNGVPYNYLAKDGIIEYNGVIFVCDEKHKAICLGNTSNMEECLRIPLSDGGCLIVNRDNLGDLSKAISMFSPEDVNRIMRAIAQDAKVQQMKNEIEETESEAVQTDSEETVEDVIEENVEERAEVTENGLDGSEDEK